MKTALSPACPAASSSGWPSPGPWSARPKVLLLDEPLGALDLKLRKDMQEELKKIQKQTGITFVFVTHDQEEALSMSDTVVVMSEGKIHQIGTPIDIYNEPQNAFVADFIGESNILDGVMLEDCKRLLLRPDLPLPGQRTLAGTCRWTWWSGRRTWTSSPWSRASSPGHGHLRDLHGRPL